MAFLIFIWGRDKTLTDWSLKLAHIHILCHNPVWSLEIETPKYLEWPKMHSIQSFDLLSFFVAVSTCVWDWFLSGFTVVLDFLLLWFAVCDFRLCRLCHFGGRHYCWLNLVWMWCVCRWCLTSLMVACRLRPMTSWVILHSKSSLLPTKTKKIVKIENSGCS